MTNSDGTALERLGFGPAVRQADETGICWPQGGAHGVLPDETLDARIVAGVTADGGVYACKGMCSHGSTCAADSDNMDARAQANFAYLFRKLARLFTCGDASSLSRAEATQLADSLAFALGIDDSGAAVDGCDGAAMVALASLGPEELFRQRQQELAARVDAALETWRAIVELMPPIRNVALRDTLASIGRLRTCYDTYFAAHEVPCDIDYQLSCPVDEHLKGIDYIQAYLDLLLCETRWIARFEPKNCIAMLERICPDYRGLHVNLYDLLKPHEGELGKPSGCFVSKCP